MWCFVQFTNAKDILAKSQQPKKRIFISIQLMYEREREREREREQLQLQEANDEGKIVGAQKHLLL